MNIYLKCFKCGEYKTTNFHKYICVDGSYTKSCIFCKSGFKVSSKIAPCSSWCRLGMGKCENNEKHRSEYTLNCLNEECKTYIRFCH